MKRIKSEEDREAFMLALALNQQDATAISSLRYAAVWAIGCQISKREFLKAAKAGYETAEKIINEGRLVLPPPL